MDYSVTDLTITVYDNDNAIILRKYPVVSMLVPQTKKTNKSPELPVMEPITPAQPKRKSSAAKKKSK